MVPDLALKVKEIPVSPCFALMLAFEDHLPVVRHANAPFLEDVREDRPHTQIYVFASVFFALCVCVCVFQDVPKLENTSLTITSSLVIERSNILIKMF